MSLSKRQLALRKDAIGGSSIAALAGLSKWASPIEIWDAMVNGTEKEENLVMRLGNALEDPVAQIYAEETGRWLKRVDTIRHPGRSYAIATPDRAVFTGPVNALSRRKLLERDQLVDAERLLEIKTTSWRLAHEWGEEGTDEIPEHHLCQVQWTLGVTGKSIADVYVLFDRDRLARYTVNFSQELFDGLYEVASRFMVDHVLTRVPPPPDTSEKYGEFLGRRFPRDNGTLLRDPSQEVVDAILHYARYKEAGRRLKLLTTRAGNIIRNAIGENTGIGLGLGKVTWKRTKDGKKTDWESTAIEALQLAGLVLNRATAGEEQQAMVTQLKSIIDRHTTSVPGYRVLRLSKLDQPEDAFQLQLPEKGESEEAEPDESEHETANEFD